MYHYPNVRTLTSFLCNHAIDIFFQFNSTISIYAVVLACGLFCSTTLLRYSLPIFDVYIVVTGTAKFPSFDNVVFWGVR